MKISMKLTDQVNGGELAVYEVWELALMAAQKVVKEFQEQHPEDMDCCGYARNAIRVGRKNSKLAKELLEIEGFEPSYEAGYLTYKDPDNFGIGHFQSLTFREKAHIAFIDTFKKFGVDGYMDSWMD